MNIDIYINEESIQILEKQLLQKNDTYSTFNCKISGTAKLIENIKKDDKRNYKKIKIESITQSNSISTLKIKLESYDDYKKLKVEDSDKIWVYNILDHTAESDRIIYEDKDIILIPDYKWNYNIDNLHILCFFKNKKLYSIRELTNEHVEMLENSLQNCKKCIKEKYDISEDNLLIYFHYHPSVWQLHIHFTNVRLINNSILIPRAHLVNQVIENLKIDTNYYKKVKLEVLT
jgi:diadenosine tetraphosphate (Ap4A) HIT family hydrolase